LQRFGTSNGGLLPREVSGRESYLIRGAVKKKDELRPRKGGGGLQRKREAHLEQVYISKVEQVCKGFK